MRQGRPSWPLGPRVKPEDDTDGEGEDQATCAPESPPSIPTTEATGNPACPFPVRYSLPHLSPINMKRVYFFKSSAPWKSMCASPHCAMKASRLCTQLMCSGSEK